ncbi:MAG TPA: hypothetical protein VH247_10590 [Thermoleophilaceae bacterium]|jgi:hypothetical protein|nr:hypothetical protein [Thermoleophilaceae bacterium]
MASQVELLWWEGCPSSEEAHELVRRVMADAGLDPDSLHSIEVATGDAAEQHRFVGSPTVRIDGRDLQPPDAGEPIGLTCRVYHLRDGRISPLPDPEDIKEALST